MTVNQVNDHWKDIEVNDVSFLRKILNNDISLEFLGEGAEHTYFFPTNERPLKKDVQEADNIFEGVLNLSPNYENVKLEVPFDWGANPFGNNNWRFILHSLRWLEKPLNAYLYTKDEKYIKLINSIIEQWIDENKVGGLNEDMAWRDHAVSFRLRFFVYYWKVYKTTETFQIEQNFNQKFVLSLYQHMLFHNEYENFHLHSNHSLEMIGAILSAAHTFNGQLLNTEAFLEMGFELLYEYIDRNFSQKGYHYEQSPAYHWYVLKRIYLIKEYFDYYGEPLDKLEHIYSLALQANYMLLKPNYFFHTIGDSGLLNMRAQLKSINAIPLEEMFNELPSFDSCPEAGYTIFRDNHHHTIFRNYNFLGSHGHNDLLSFTLHAKETDWFVDTGYYTYNKNDPFREYFLSLDAHNSMVINNDNLTKKSEKIETVVDEKQKSVMAGRYVKEGWHQRKFQRLQGDDYFIEDTVIKDSSTVFHTEQLFHLHPDITLNKMDQHFIEVENRAGIVCRISQANQIGKWEMVKGQEEPYIQGWYSEKFNRLEPTCTLKYIVHSQEDIFLKTAINFIN